MPAYDQIGDGYNHTRSADPYLVSRLLDLLAPASGHTYLDIGCGTGNYTKALSKSGLKMIGIDPSIKMLNLAQRSTSEIDWRVGSAEAIPIGDEAVHGVVATLTTHHWRDLKAGFAEVARVLKPGGNFVLFTSTPHLMRRYWLMQYFPEMMLHSMEVMPSLERTMLALSPTSIQVCNVEAYDIKSTLTDQFLYAGKHQPERYLDPQFRQGISSFRLFADSTELVSGLTQLETDIASGKWQQIRKNFQHQEGDYVFLVGRKA